jgi:hypothetical protein
MATTGAEIDGRLINRPAVTYILSTACAASHEANRKKKEEGIT